MSRFVLVSLFTFSSLLVTAQDFVSTSGGTIILTTSDDNTDKNYVERGVFVGPHVLGDELTSLMEKFEGSYVYYKQTGGAYASKVKVINKPRIYKGIKKFESYMIKEVTRNRVTENEAKRRIENLFQRGLDLLPYETSIVEVELGKIKKPEQIEEYLLSLKLK